MMAEFPPSGSGFLYRVYHKLWLRGQYNVSQIKIGLFCYMWSLRCRMPFHSIITVYSFRLSVNEYIHSDQRREFIWLLDDNIIKGFLHPSQLD